MNPHTSERLRSFQRAIQSNDRDDAFAYFESVMTEYIYESAVTSQSIGECVDALEGAGWFTGSDAPSAPLPEGEMSEGQMLEAYSLAQVRFRRNPTRGGAEALLQQAEALRGKKSRGATAPGGVGTPRPNRTDSRNTSVSRGGNRVVLLAVVVAAVTAVGWWILRKVGDP